MWLQNRQTSAGKQTPVARSVLGGGSLGQHCNATRRRLRKCTEIATAAARNPSPREGDSRTHPKGECRRATDALLRYEMRRGTAMLRYESRRIAAMRSIHQRIQSPPEEWQLLVSMLNAQPHYDEAAEMHKLRIRNKRNFRRRTYNRCARRRRLRMRAAVPRPIGCTLHLVEGGTTEQSQTEEAMGRGSPKPKASRASRNGSSRRAPSLHLKPRRGSSNPPKRSGPRALLRGGDELASPLERERRTRRHPFPPATSDR